MAIARPIRVLALAAIVLWGLFIYMVFGPQGYRKGPGDIINSPHPPEPLLESACSLQNSCDRANISYSNW